VQGSWHELRAEELGVEEDVVREHIDDGVIVVVRIISAEALVHVGEVNLRFDVRLEIDLAALDLAREHDQVELDITRETAGTRGWDDQVGLTLVIVIIEVVIAIEVVIVLVVFLVIFLADVAQVEVGRSVVLVLVIIVDGGVEVVIVGLEV
jgi:hypothetical protein